MSESTMSEMLRLRDLGLPVHAIARELGVSRWSVLRALEPDRYHRQLARARALKEGYRGRCEECGASTSGCNGPGKAPRLCSGCSHQKQHAERHWTAEVILDGIRRYASEHGHPPVSTLSSGQSLEPRPDYLPGLIPIFREFGSWANAIEAAGFTRPVVGHNLYGSKTKFDLESVCERIRAFVAANGRAPSAREMNGEAQWLRRNGFGWRYLLVELGIKPLPVGRRRR